MSFYNNLCNNLGTYRKIMTNSSHHTPRTTILIFRDRYQFKPDPSFPFLAEFNIKRNFAISLINYPYFHLLKERQQKIYHLLHSVQLLQPVPSSHTHFLFAMSPLHPSKHQTGHNQYTHP